VSRTISILNYKKHSQSTTPAMPPPANHRNANNYKRKINAAEQTDSMQSPNMPL